MIAAAATLQSSKRGNGETGAQVCLETRLRDRQYFRTSAWRHPVVMMMSTAAATLARGQSTGSAQRQVGERGVNPGLSSCCLQQTLIIGTTACAAATTVWIFQ